VDLAFWRNISVIWLAFLCFLGLLLPLAASLFIVKGMHALVDRTPRLLRQVQGYSRAVRNQVDTASDYVAAPVIQAHKVGTRYTTLLDHLFRRHRSPWRGDKKE
jgi:hypothetical protein